MESEPGTMATSNSAVATDLGKLHMIPSDEVVTDSAAQDKHLRAFEQGCAEWESYQNVTVPEAELRHMEDFVIVLLLEHEFQTEQEYERAIRLVRKSFKVQPAKPQIVRAYYRLVASGRIEQHAAFERIVTKKAVRSNSGVVVITVVTAPGRFSCGNDCFYCPDEPGQPRSYLSTEPAVARANQNNFDPVRQFYDRAGTLAKQGHTVDKVEIIVLGGTWSGYPKDYQEAFCRDLFFAANTFDEDAAKVGQGRHWEDEATTRPRKSILEEQNLNERARAKIIGLTLETRPDHITPAEIKRLRKFGCTRVQIGVQHTDDDVLRYVNRGHERSHAVSAVHLLKTCGFKVDLHIMPDLPSSTPEKDEVMFDDILHGEELQADHWKIYPCEVTPFTTIEKWYNEGSYMPYTETDPRLLTDLLTKVKAEVHPWIRLNRVIRDIPEVSIIAGNQNTNLRQAIFMELKKRGQSCRCIRCREVRDWPETAEGLRVRVREYRSSHGTEFFISIEGSDRGLGGGATQRGLNGANGKRSKPTKAEKKARKAARDASKGGGKGEQVPTEVVEAIPDTMPGFSQNADDNATLYGLLRLRLNDDPAAPGEVFPELGNCALIRELHVYGVLVAAREDVRGAEGEVEKDETKRPQHAGIGRTLMATAERLASSRGWSSIAVISGIGVRNYYRRLGYEQRGEGQYLIKEIEAVGPELGPSDLELPFLEVATRIKDIEPRSVKEARRRFALAVTVGLAAVGIAGIALRRRWHRASA